MSDVNSRNSSLANSPRPFLWGGKWHSLSWHLNPEVSSCDRIATDPFLIHASAGTKTIDVWAESCQRSSLRSRKWLASPVHHYMKMQINVKCMDRKFQYGSKISQQIQLNLLSTSAIDSENIGRLKAPLNVSLWPWAHCPAKKIPSILGAFHEIVWSKLRENKIKQLISYNQWTSSCC